MHRQGDLAVFVDTEGFGMYVDAKQLWKSNE